MIEITTPRLKIVPLTLDEAKAVADLVTEKISRWTSPIPWPYALKDAEWWINNSAPEKRLGIYLGETLIGTTSIPAKNGDEVGFWIHETFEGNGYATEAAAAIVNYTFSNIGLDCIDSFVHRDNIGSRRVHEKLGFQMIEETERYWPNKDAMVPVVLYRLQRRIIN